jgi:hypothetical protein
MTTRSRRKFTQNAWKMPTRNIGKYKLNACKITARNRGKCTQNATKMPARKIGKYKRNDYQIAHKKQLNTSKMRGKMPVNMKVKIQVLCIYFYLFFVLKASAAS